MPDIPELSPQAGGSYTRNPDGSLKLTWDPLAALDGETPTPTPAPTSAPAKTSAPESTSASNT